MAGSGSLRSRRNQGDAEALSAGVAGVRRGVHAGELAPEQSGGSAGAAAEVKLPFH